MAVLTGVYIAEIFLQALLLIKLLKAHDVRFRRLVILTGACFIQLLMFLFSLFDTTSVPELFVVYVLLSLVNALIFIASDVIANQMLEIFLQKLSMKNSVSKGAFFIFRLFIGIDALLLLTNPLHGLAFRMQQLPVGNFSVILYPHLELWGQVHCYVILLQILTVAVALFYRGLSLPLLYGIKYIIACVLIGTSYVITIIYTYITDAFLLRLLLMVMVSLAPFILYYIVYRNRPFLTAAYIRQMVVEKLGSPMVLFDIDGLLVDFNTDAAALFALDTALISRMSLPEFLKRAVGSQFRERTTSTVEEVVVPDASGAQQVFKLDYTKLYDQKQKSLGTLLLFHNVTELKTLYNTMEKAAMTDMITGLASKVMLEKKIAEINLYRKYPYCAVVGSINGLNLISAGFGENSETAAIMHVADVLRSHLRASDFAAYADGNMVVLMTDTLESEARLVFSRISDILSHDQTFNFKLSFEYGVAEKFSKDSDIQLTIAQAQAVMLKRKLISHSYAEASIVESLQKALRESSFETELHSIRVSELSVKIAEKLNLPAEEYEDLKLLALFHDIGKLSVPSELLSKPEKLSEEESQIMMMHTINGSKVAMASKELASVARGILCHHEHWDGTGYPNGFSGEQIPYLARIVAVADAYDVMTHDRPWMQAMAPDVAVDRIRAQSGKQFDPSVIKAFLQLNFQKIEK
ncbi:MAG: HD domain-containing protein [Treponema sp.]|nr:HD domain-containing protein [Treponema sp.]